MEESQLAPCPSPTTQMYLGSFYELSVGGCLSGLRAVAQQLCGSEVGELMTFYLQCSSLQKRLVWLIVFSLQCGRKKGIRSCTSHVNL